jgi:hypothetical protein
VKRVRFTPEAELEIDESPRRLDQSAADVDLSDGLYSMPVTR